MHQHDPDLIMALAEGKLDVGESAAVAEIQACPQCSADLQMQRVALDAVASSPRVYLTAVESARLREAVRGELAISEAESKDRFPARRRFTLGALAGAAAVLIAVVIVAPALNLVGGDSRETTRPQDIAFAPQPVESADAAPEAEPLPSAPPAPSAAPTPAPAPAAAAPTAPGAVEEVRAAVDASAFGSGGIRALAGEVDLEELRARLVGRGEKSVGEVLTESAYALLAEQDQPTEGTAAGAPPPEAAVACDLDAATTSARVASATIVASAMFEGRQALIIYYEGETPEDALLVALDIITCEVLGSA